MSDLEKTARMALEQPAKHRHIAYVCPQCYWTLEEQPAQQQEPVAWAWRNTKTDGRGVYWENPDQKIDLAKFSDYEFMPLYTSPPASKPWVGLTQQDIDIAFDDTQECGGFDDFARAIEAKLKEKNA